MNINDAFNDVKAFHEAFGHPAPDYVTFLAPGRATARANWKREEADELEEAAKLATDAIDAVVLQADAAIDGLYFNLGTLVELGVDPGPLFDIVHQANMTKMHEVDGVPTVVYYPEGHEKAGKVMKPVDWEDPAPKLRAEIIRQMEALDK